MLDRTRALELPVHPATSGFATSPLCPAIGAEIHGVDIAAGVSDAVFARILDTWHENCVILLRHQSLDEEQQWNFARRFGQTGKVQHAHNGGSKLPGVMYISNIRENGELIGSLPDGEMFFHSDQCYTPNPAIATMLYAMQVPSQGGDTLFANMFTAYDELTAEMKARLEPLKAMNVYDYLANATTRGSVIREGIPHFAHNIVQTHPANGRKALYVNRLMSDHIVGMDPGESESLLNFLFDHCERPELIYAHKWTPGDLLIWDNRSCTHARTDFSAAEHRLMRRVAIVSPNSP